MILKKNKNLKKSIICFYFIVAGIEITAELFSYKPLLFIFKPLISILLMFLYWKTSNQRNKMFVIVVSLSLLTNMFFIPNTEKMLLIGIIIFSLHRILTILYIIKLTQVKDYFPLLISVIPFLFVFFYLFAISNEIPRSSYYVLIVQILLVSILGGIGLADYAMNDNKRNTWLLIYALLSVALSFIVFIEKWYLSDMAPTVFRPLAMILNTAVYYTFYKFVIEAEKPKMVSENLIND